MKTKCFSAIIILVFTITGLSTGPQAIGGLSPINRTDKTFMFYLGVNDPLPGAYGLNVGINVSEFLRFDLGLGVATQIPKPPLTEFALIWGTVFAWLFTVGVFKVADIYHTLSGDSTADLKILSSYGGGFRLLVPHWMISPYVGARFMGMSSTNHPYNFPDNDFYAYPVAGVELQSNEKPGLFASLGAAVVPKAPGDQMYRFTLDLGLPIK